jgi:hypothetical protein
MNNVDLAIVKLRELQQLFFNSDASPNMLFKKSTEIFECMEKASKEIQANYEDISKRLTEEMNTGKKQ